MFLSLNILLNQFVEVTLVAVFDDRDNLVLGDLMVARREY
jgi:hypothetical protein